MALDYNRIWVYLPSQTEIFWLDFLQVIVFGRKFPSEVAAQQSQIFRYPQLGTQYLTGKFVTIKEVRWGNVFELSRIGFNLGVIAQSL